MSDLFLGQTCTEMYKYRTSAVTPAVPLTVTFGFQPDQVDVINLTAWAAGTAGLRPISRWYRDTPLLGTGDAFQEVVIDATGATFALILANGFTVADTTGGQSTSHSTISAISATDPVVITHSAFTFQDNQVIRITDLGQVTSATNRGMGQLNNNRYKVVVLTPTTISLKDVITGEPIDGTAFTPYVAPGGRITLETHVNALNHPQVTPYSNTNPYDPNPFSYDPILYQLTIGGAVAAGSAILVPSSEFRIVAFKYGKWQDLGISA